MPRVHILGTGSTELASALSLTSLPLKEADVAVFLVSAQSGIVRADSDQWSLARELYIPSIVVITDLSAENETDFEDMSAIASRILDPVVTPFLVLHSDSGTPAALIDLDSLMITDYTTMPAVIKESETEHRDLIGEFRTDYLDAVEAAGEGAFENGLLFPAIAWVPESALGINEIKNYLQRIPTFS